MAVSTTNRKAGPFVGNDATTVFPFTFKVFDAEDLLVVLTDDVLVENTLVLDTDYTVILNGDQDDDPGGSVTLADALATDTLLTITSQVEATQSVVLTSQGGFYPSVINRALDKITIIAQQLAEIVGRTIRLPLSSTANGELPVPVPNALLGWNGTGDGFTNVDIADLVTAGAYGTARVEFYEGDGIKVDFDLENNPGNVANVLIFIGGVAQFPGIDFSLVSARRIRFVEAPFDGAVIQVRYYTGGAIPAVDDLVRSDGSNAEAAAFRNAIGAASAFDLAAAAIPSTTASVTLYTNEATGNDTTGDGSVGTPFATVNRALAAVPLLTSRANVRIVVTGDVTDSWRPAADMIRPALVYVDGVKIGKRTDITGGTTTGGLVIDLSAATLKPGATFTRGIYATGGCGSVGLVLGLTDPQAGAEALIVAHRGAYLHVYGGPSGAVADGKGICELGLVAEAGGYMEAVEVGAINSTVDVQVYYDSSVQLAAPITSVVVGKASVGNSGTLSLVFDVEVTGTLTSRGGMIDLVGTAPRPVKLSGNYDGQAGTVTGTSVRFTNAASSIVPVGEQWKIDALHSNAQLNFRAGSATLNNFQSFVSPATQSTHTQPIRCLDGAKLTFSSTINNLNSATLILGEDLGASVVTVAADATVIPVALNGQNPQAIRLNNTKGSLATGCTLSREISGRLAGTRIPNGQMITLSNLGGSGVQIVNGTTATGMNGGNYTVGATAGQYRSVTFIYFADYGLWMPLAPEQMVTLTAPLNTYVAPAGGATVDAEARAALAQLAADVANFRSKTQAARIHA